MKVFEASQDSGGHPKLSFVVPKKEAEGFVNNKKESYNFRYACVHALVD